ncbi:hypothetical protein LEP1GSC193_0779 [Leptospira phage vB_LalZ_80412-LE1]|uniref:Uncharacterized protein n=2 Tax=Leptospira alstonii TaxID=28452 RepID=M6D2F0_9LEPT|nr:hypothetical protein LEP1GSC193_0779 [Leptospira phage vB_LalZ_80412-LE1]EMJ95358.1 hypothetical protein LEP1GSC194_3579 [Leptospira alstonii serovar Sichuan str. 79601]
MATYFPNVFEGMPEQSDSQLVFKLLLVNQLAALAPWSFSKGVYKFSKELAKELVSSALPEKIPTEILKKIPLWSIYVEIPEGIIEDCNGFFVFLESTDGEEELRILPDYDNQPPFPLILKLGDYTVEESILELLKTNTKKVEQKLGFAGFERIKESIKTQTLELEKFITLILYICSENAEITGTYSHTTYKQRAKEKSNIELNQAAQVTVWDVGKEIGKKLRDYRETKKQTEIQSNMKSPHIRRAHWHHFWIGGKRSKELLLRWLSPIPVNL